MEKVVHAEGDVESGDLGGEAGERAPSGAGVAEPPAQDTLERTVDRPGDLAGAAQAAAEGGSERVGSIGAGGGAPPGRGEDPDAEGSQPVARPVPATAADRLGCHCATTSRVNTLLSLISARCPHRAGLCPANSAR